MKNLILILTTINLFGCQPSIPEKVVANEILVQPEKRIETMDSTIVLNCSYTGLSTVFDFAIQFKHVVNTEDYSLDSSLVSISILDKKHRKIDSVHLKAVHFYDAVFESCENVRSFSTGKNKNKQVVDSDYGKFIVADFNFDAREDFAVISESANSGEMYTYFVQDKNRKFKIDRFLTDSVMWFPEIFDPKNKTLAYGVRCGVCGWSQVAFQYNPKTGNWKTSGKRMLNVCEEKIESSEGYFIGKPR